MKMVRATKPPMTPPMTAPTSTLEAVAVMMMRLEHAVPVHVWPLMVVTMAPGAVPAGAPAAMSAATVVLSSEPSCVGVSAEMVPTVVDSVCTWAVGAEAGMETVTV